MFQKLTDKTAQGAVVITKRLGLLQETVTASDKTQSSNNLSPRLPDREGKVSKLGEMEQRHSLVISELSKDVKILKDKLNTTENKLTDKNIRNWALSSKHSFKIKNTLKISGKHWNTKVEGPCVPLY